MGIEKSGEQKPRLQNAPPGTVQAPRGVQVAPERGGCGTRVPASRGADSVEDGIHPSYPPGLCVSLVEDQREQQKENKPRKNMERESERKLPCPNRLLVTMQSPSRFEPKKVSQRWWPGLPSAPPSSAVASVTQASQILAGTPPSPPCPSAPTSAGCVFDTDTRDWTGPRGRHTSKTLGEASEQGHRRPGLRRQRPPLARRHRSLPRCSPHGPLGTRTPSGKRGIAHPSRRGAKAHSNVKR